jgi:hypothetical protein
MPAAISEMSSPRPGASPIGLLALILATLFAGAAIYILVAEQPARLVLEDRSLLLQWQQSYPRAARMQAGLAVLASLVGGFAFWRSRDLLWLAGATLMLANLPFTLIVIAPINNELLALSPEQAGSTCRALVERWGWLHAVRAGLSLAAMAAFAGALRRSR